MFDLYPRHSHRTPQQIAEDTGSAFEPVRPVRPSDDSLYGQKSVHAGEPSRADGSGGAGDADDTQPR